MLPYFSSNCQPSRHSQQLSMSTKLPLLLLTVLLLLASSNGQSFVYMSRPETWWQWALFVLTVGCMTAGVLVLICCCSLGMRRTGPSELELVQGGQGSRSNQCWSVSKDKLFARGQRSYSFNELSTEGSGKY